MRISDWSSDVCSSDLNAVVIALACRNLQHKQRIQGILWGTAGAIILRVLLIAFALTLLGIPFLKIVGALLLVWIGIKLLIPDEDEHGNIKGGSSVMRAEIGRASCRERVCQYV